MSTELETKEAKEAPLVMISLNVPSMKASAQILKSKLEQHGMRAWLCFENLAGGEEYRTEIVNAVKNCDVFLPLINQEWALSGECEDEYSLAKRRNLTSHEAGRTTRDKPRKPIILPIAFPNLDWSHPHIELLAAKTNFVIHPESQLSVSEASASTLNSVLLALRRSGLEVTNLSADLALKIESFSKTQQSPDGDQSSRKVLSGMRSNLDEMQEQLRGLTIKLQQAIAACPEDGPSARFAKDWIGTSEGHKMGGEYKGSKHSHKMSWWDSVRLEFHILPDGKVEGEVTESQLRKLVDGSNETVPEDHILFDWQQSLSVEKYSLAGLYDELTGAIDITGFRPNGKPTYFFFIRSEGKLIGCRIGRTTRSALKLEPVV